MAEGEEKIRKSDSKWTSNYQSVSIKTDMVQVNYQSQEQMWKANVIEDHNRDQTMTRPIGICLKTTHRYSDGTLADEIRVCWARWRTFKHLPRWSHRPDQTPFGITYTNEKKMTPSNRCDGLWMITNYIECCAQWRTFVEVKRQRPEYITLVGWRTFNWRR